MYFFLFSFHFVFAVFSPWIDKFKMVQSTVIEFVFNQLYTFQCSQRQAKAKKGPKEPKKKI